MHAWVSPRNSNAKTSHSEKTHPRRITSAPLHEWAASWSDVTEFEFIPVISSRKISEKMAWKE
ncbi:MAG: DUF3303 family protein [Oscillospiraceae bacterium]